MSPHPQPQQLVPWGLQGLVSVPPPPPLPGWWPGALWKPEGPAQCGGWPGPLGPSRCPRAWALRLLRPSYLLVLLAQQVQRWRMLGTWILFSCKKVVSRSLRRKFWVPGGFLNAGVPSSLRPGTAVPLLRGPAAGCPRPHTAICSLELFRWCAPRSIHHRLLAPSAPGRRQRRPFCWDQAWVRRGSPRGRHCPRA